MSSGIIDDGVYFGIEVVLMNVSDSVSDKDKERNYDD